MKEPRAERAVEPRANRAGAAGTGGRPRLRAALFLSLAVLGLRGPAAADPLPAAPADAATGTVRFLFEPPPGASPAELCRLIEVRAVRLVFQEGAAPREEPVARPAPVRGEAEGPEASWDRSCRFTLRGLESGSSYRIRARLRPSPWWGQGWEYQEVCPREGGIPASAGQGTHRCEPIRR